MSDDSGWSIPSFQTPNYGLNTNNPNTITGNSDGTGLSVNTGNYNLGDPLGDSSGGGGLHFGDSPYTGDNTLGGLYRPLPVPQLPMEAQSELKDMFNFGNRFGMKLGAPSPYARMPGIQENSSNNSLDNLNNAVLSQPQVPESKEPGLFDKGGTLYNWGIRKPGTEEARNFFGTETNQERDLRMGKVGDFISGAAGTLIPGAGALNMAKGAYNAYNGLQQGASLADTAGRFLSGFGGGAGALGNTLTGNYGGAVSNLIPGVGGRAAGLGIDALQGKDVTPAAFTLGGNMVGNKIAGPVGGFIGSKLGSGLAGLFGKKK